MNKKIIITILVAILLIMLFYIGYFMYENKAKDNILKHNHIEDVTKIDDKTNMYIFWGDGCPHCEEFALFISKLEKKYKNKINIYAFETWYDEENQELYKEFNELLDANATGVPFIIIGDKYFKGYTSLYDDDIKEAILDTYDYDIYDEYTKKEK